VRKVFLGTSKQDKLKAELFARMEQVSSWSSPDICRQLTGRNYEGARDFLMGSQDI
jgi:hypothetical protein